MDFPLDETSGDLPNARKLITLIGRHINLVAVVAHIFLNLVFKDAAIC